MPRTNSDQLHGTLDMLVLKALQQQRLHGYAIALRLEQLSRDVLQVEEGSLYPALYRMEARGWLSSEWAVTDTGRRARFYKLTRPGTRAARSRDGELDAPDDRCPERARQLRPCGSFGM